MTRNYQLPVVHLQVVHFSVATEGERKVLHAFRVPQYEEVFWVLNSDKQSSLNQRNATKLSIAASEEHMAMCQER
jgi:hypothetical protein